MTKDRWENTVWDTDIYLDDIDKENDIKTPPFTDGQKEVIEAIEKLAEKCDKISANVNKWGRKNICDVDDDIDEFPKIYAEPQPSKDFLPINCYVCNASGWIAGNSYRHTSKCTRCNGTGKINFYSLTNEDFLRTATTEQLAEYLADKFNEVVDFVLHEVDENAEDIEPDDYWYRQDVIVEWLKKPHTNE